MKRLSKILLLIIPILLLTSGTTFAQEQFSTKYNVKYTIQADGEAHVTQDISIINKENDVVATNYTLIIDNTDIYDVSGRDGDGSLDIETTTENGATRVYIEFNERVIGKDRSLDWRLEYKTRDIASKVGEVWNINIPKIVTLESTEEYTIDLVVPNTLGPKIYISPEPQSETNENGTYTLRFDKGSLEQNGITASFGSYQVLNFQLKYKLQNTGMFARYQDVALPPSVQKDQQVKIANIDPNPERIYTDQDGNLLATFRVPSKSSLEVRVSGNARILGNQINPVLGGQLSDIPWDIKSRYTKPEKYWESRSNQIRAKARELTDNKLNVSQNAQNIYNFVVQNLDYNFGVETQGPIQRHGALAAITEAGPWACMEFTDLFIALARAAGIPARELNGYALVKDSSTTPLSLNFQSGDVLHSWAEFYDPNFGWTQVDPTWGKTSGTDYFTKLDTNHFIFVIKGSDSEYPYPAGAYKIDGTEKQVEVDIAQNPEQISFSESLTVYEDGTLFNSGGIEIYNVNETGKTLGPFGTTKIRLPKDSRSGVVAFENFNGEGKTFEYIVREGNPPISGRAFQPTQVILSVFLAILLCSLIYYSSGHLKYLRK